MAKEIFNDIMNISDNRENFEKLTEDFKRGNILPFLGQVFLVHNFQVGKIFWKIKQ